MGGALRILNCILSSLGLLVFCLGVYDVTQNLGKNNCEMTYMYEMPMYEPVFQSENGKYGLYLYKEASKRDMETRIPVLFIPGNAGSYKQVRSLASVSLRMAIDKKHTFEYDFYSIDFNEEYSALYGGFLMDQTNFVMECLEWMNSQYSKESGIIMIGHSIGGLIGRNVIAHSNYALLENRVRCLVTLATPHSPIVIPDTGMDYFYRRLPYIDPKISYINIGGGERDIQVRSGLALFEDADVNVILNSSPGIWVSADHRCIVWCKQLIIAMNRALSEIVQGGIIKDRDTISAAFKYHLQKRHYFFKSYKVAAEYKVRPFPNDPSAYSYSWIFEKTFHFSLSHKIDETTIFLLNTSPESKEVALLESFNLRGNWIFGCRGQEEGNICVGSKNMFDLVHVLPGKRRSVTHLSLNSGRFSHYAIVVQKGCEAPRFNLDVYEPSSRLISVESKNVLDQLGLPMILQEKTEPSATFYNITFPGLTSTWKAYEIGIEPLPNCYVPEEALGSFHFINPNSNELTHAQINKNISYLNAKLLSISPKQEMSHMLIYLNNKCSYRIEARVSWLQSFGQIVRFYTPMIVPLFISVILFAISSQYRTFEEEKYFYSLWTIKILTPFQVLMYLKIGSTVLNFILSSYSITLSSHAVEHPGLYGALFCISMGCAFVFCIVAWALVVIGGYILSKLVSNLTFLPEFVSDYLLQYIWRLSPLIFPIFISIAFSTCGSFVIFIGLLLHVLKLFKLYEDYLQDIAKDERSPQLLSEFTYKSTSMNFIFSITMLWFLSFLLNFPILLTWIRNDFSSLSYDPSFLTAIILSATGIYSLSNSQINPNLKGYSVIAYLISISGFINIMFFVLKVYRINYTINLTLILITLHQLLAPKICQD